MTKAVDFYFDYSSPFAYLGSTQIEAAAARHGATVNFRPFLLGALFKAIGTPDAPILSAPLAKQRIYNADMHRWADHYGVPFRFPPSRFPVNTIKPLRMTLAVPEADRPRLIHALFRAYWADDRDLADDTTLADIATAAGFDGPALVAATREERLKNELRAATEAAVQIGVCGAPSYAVGKLLFWGQDRLLFVERALDGWIPKGEEG
ncbi:MAG: 2-hydroxychromene-2-carboxylate isomerase [Polyangiaceae bacterium]|nr:2-hydroxychromene-2-carboxylate isomerase [Polyangiaceae bacterium]